jgi:hypothetical protein
MCNKFRGPQEDSEVPGIDNEFKINCYNICVFRHVYYFIMMTDITVQILKKTLITFRINKCGIYIISHANNYLTL